MVFFSKCAFSRVGVQVEPTQELSAIGADDVGLDVMDMGVHESGQYQLAGIVGNGHTGREPRNQVLRRPNLGNIAIIEDEQAVFEKFKRVFPGVVPRVIEKVKNRAPDRNATRVFSLGGHQQGQGLAMKKIYISAASLLQDSFRLAAKIYRSGFRPDFIVGIWRGGSPVGIAIQEYFEYVGAKTDHIAVRTSSYTGIGHQSKTIRVHGLHYIIENCNASDSLLIVDDVFDSGRSIEALLQQFVEKTRLNMPETVKIACPWYKPEKNQTELVPHYYLHETDRWIVFPHELVGLDFDDINEGKTELQPILDLFQSE